MSDKAAREAFEKLYADELVASGHTCGRSFAKFDDGSYVTHMVQVRWVKFAQGYQAAHDAAMAAKPDVQEIIRRLVTLTRSPGEKRTLADDATAVFESLLLKLQAAQQREATLVTLAEEAERGGRICRELGLGHDVQRASVWEHVAATIRAALATQPASKGETT